MAASGNSVWRMPLVILLIVASWIDARRAISTFVESRPLGPVDQDHRAAPVVHRNFSDGGARPSTVS